MMPLIITSIYNSTYSFILLKYFGNVFINILVKTFIVKLFLFNLIYNNVFINSVWHVKTSVVIYLAISPILTIQTRSSC